MAENDRSAERKQETEHIIAFLDLLGASEKITGEASESVLNRISELFGHSKRCFTQEESALELKCATFSDNIVFSLDLSEMAFQKKEAVITEFLRTIAFFQSVALEYDLLFRGGIALNRLYMDPRENLVWGKALVDAHQLEEKAAIYPRIVLSRQFEKMGFRFSGMPVRMDFDGLYFIDYMPMTIKLFPDWVENAERLIQTEYDRASPQDKDWGNERILQKYAWLRHYINQCKPI